MDFLSEAVDCEYFYPAFEGELSSVVKVIARWAQNLTKSSGFGLGKVLIIGLIAHFLNFENVNST